MRKQIKPLRCYWPQYLRGFVCAHHPAAPAPGSNPKHTIYAFLKKKMLLAFKHAYHTPNKGNGK